MIIRINPLDTFFFRDARPFEMSEESWANSIFPPSPSVIYGALKTLYATYNNIDFKDADNKLQDLEIQNIYFNVKGNNPHFPLPFDLVEPKKKKNTEEEERQEKEREKLDKTYLVKKLKLNNKPAFSSLENELSSVLISNEQIESVKNGLFDDVQLENYLNNNFEGENKIKKTKDWIKSEPKVGIGRDNKTRTSSESQLYRVDMQRFSSINLIIQFKEPEGLKFPEEGFMKLGGEGKIADYQVVKRGAFEFQKESIEFQTDNYFKVYMLTPAIFKNGWHPNIQEKLGFDAKLLTAAIDKPIHIGGFDMLLKKPKTMQKAIPAGSVFCYETSKENLHKLREKQGISLSDFLEKQGFGIAYFGNF